MEVAMHQLLRRLTSITRRSPLRRRVDRVQNALLIALIALLLGATPFLTAASGHWARVTGLQELRNERIWHQVTATITHSQSGPPRTLASRSNAVRSMARWTAPDGQTRSGLITARPDKPAMSSVRLWVNHAGRPTGPPLRLRQLHQRIIVVELLTIWALLVAGLVVAMAGRRLLDWHRLATWEKEWRVIAPSWTRQP
jgi:hypothetical protein